MAFQGDLRNIGLASVFQNLQQNLQSGTLKLQKDRDERFLFVKKGKIGMLAREKGAQTPLGDYLVRAGKITREHLDAAGKRRRKGQRLGSALVRAADISEKDVKAAVQQFVEEELYDLFTWADGRFEFTEGEPSSDVFDADARAADLSLDPNGIILEAARRVDEWERINRVVGSLGEIYLVRAEAQADLENLTDPRARRVAEFLDGRRDVAAVIQDSALGRFAVCQGLSKLISERVVNPIAGDELKVLAARAESSGDLEEAACMLRRALETEPGDVALRRRLAEVLVRGGEKEGAASEYKLIANSLLDGARTGEAVDALRRAIELRPGDVASRERLFQVLYDSGGKTVALETGTDLAGTYAKLGLNEKARDALLRMLDLDPHDRPKIERKLIEAHLALGDVPSAVEVLRRIARRSLKSRDYDEAGEVYEEILKLDNKDEEARKRTAEIQAGVIERMMERRRARTRKVVAAAVVLPALAFVVREFASRPAESRERLEAARSAVEAAHAFGRGRLLLEQKRYDKAVKSFEKAAVGFSKAAGVVERFREEWGWTLASRAAAKDVAEWRLRSAEIWFEIALARENTGDFDEAYRVYAKLDRQPGVPLEVARKAEESLERLKPLVKDATGVLP